MNLLTNAIECFLLGAQRNDAAPGIALDAIRRDIAYPPDDYLAFLTRSNGAEGSIGRKNYLVLWNAEDIGVANAEYKSAIFMPGMVLIGTDGGNTGYGFDCRVAPHPIVEVPLVAMGWGDARVVAPNFAAFIAALTEES